MVIAMAKVTGFNAKTPAALRLPPHPNAEVHARIIADLRKMTPTDFLASLVQAGICTPDGKLAEHYVEKIVAPDAE